MSPSSAFVSSFLPANTTSCSSFVSARRLPVCTVPAARPAAARAPQMGVFDGIAKMFGVGGEEEEVETVKVIVRYGTREPLRFRIPLTEPLRKVEEAFYDNTGKKIRLVKDGIVINSNLTAPDLGLEEGQILDSMDV